MLFMYNKCLDSKIINLKFFFLNNRLLKNIYRFLFIIRYIA